MTYFPPRFIPTVTQRSAFSVGGEFFFANLTETHLASFNQELELKEESFQEYLKAMAHELPPPGQAIPTEMQKPPPKQTSALASTSMPFYQGKILKKILGLITDRCQRILESLKNFPPKSTI